MKREFPHILHHMIIGIDASRAFLRERTGIEEYAYQLISHLRDHISETHQVVLYVRSHQYDTVKKECFSIPKHWSIREISPSRFWTQVGLSWEMMLRTPDVLFIPAHTVPFIHPKRTVVTVHGLEYERCPSAYSFLSRVYMRLAIRLSCRWTRTVIAVSKSTKRDLISFYNVLEQKITVVYEGCGSEKQDVNISKTSSEVILSKFGIAHAPYFLYVGRLEERKNIVRIVRAFALFKKSYGTAHVLVLAGKPGYGYAHIQESIRSSDARADVVETGYISEEEKQVLLRSADCLLFLSLCEGFGLPILEAQSAGVSVVASNIPAISEVAGAGAFLVSPFDEEKISEAIFRAVSQNFERNDILKKGKVNTERFSWEQCARETAQLFFGLN